MVRLNLKALMRRIIDFLFAAICIAILSPIFLLVALAIRLTSKGPIVFRQRRVGLNEQPFEIYKFRSMYVHDDAPETLGAIKHNHRLVTPVGYFIRRTKLDEIPQFFNVLLGSMSIVGPRPCLISRIPTMSKTERRRFHLLPGVTGWAEVNGNVELDWDEQLKLDLWYVDHRSFLLDVKIVLKTIFIMLGGSVKNSKALQRATTYLQVKE